MTIRRRDTFQISKVLVGKERRRHLETVRLSVYTQTNGKDGPHLRSRICRDLKGRDDVIGKLSKQKDT